MRKTAALRQFLWLALIVPFPLTAKAWDDFTGHTKGSLGKITCCKTGCRGNERSQTRKIDMACQGGLLDGKAVAKPEPTYPPEALAARVSGTVVVRVRVDEEGKVESATACAGPPMLRQSAAAAAYRARISPTLLSGKPVKVSGVLTYHFSLKRKKDR